MFKLKFKKGDETVTIDYLIGVHLLVFQTAMESLEKIDKRKAITIPSYRFPPDMVKGKPRERMTGKKNPI